MNAITRYPWWQRKGRIFTLATVGFLMIVIAVSLAEGFWPDNFRAPGTKTWLIVWAALQGAMLIPMLLLLFGDEGRRTHAARRLRELLNWIWRAWIALLALWLGHSFSEATYGWPTVVIAMGIAGILIALIGWGTLRKYHSDPGSMFP